LIDPTAEYDHDGEISNVRGYVYRECAIPPLHGNDVFGEWMLGFGT